MESKEVTTYQEAIKCLEAVIVADSFSTKFKPVSHELLKCLFPVANVPLITYVIEMLIMNNVTDIYIASCTHRAKLDKVIKNMNLSKKGVKVTILQMDDSKSLGDVLREIF
jgi:translation initiation factor eIF-2B subunit epsilon